MSLKAKHDALYEETRQVLSDSGARYIVELVRILASQVGKQKTIELIKAFRYEPHVIRGRESAEKLGKPRDLSTFLEEYFTKAMAAIPVVEPVKFTERRENRAVCYVDWYCPGKALARFVGEDKELQEIFKEAWCRHDVAFCEGFNPDIKMSITKIFYDGDDRCEFTMEL